MTKMKINNNPLRRVGAPMHNARVKDHISRNEVSRLLHIKPTELAAYERGTADIPPDILEFIFCMGYKMMRMRLLEHEYREQRRAVRKQRATTTSDG